MNSFSFGRGRLLIAMWHAATFALSLKIAYLLHFDVLIPSRANGLFWTMLWIALLTKTLIFSLTGLLRPWSWEFVDVDDLYRLITGNALASLEFGAATLVLVGPSVPGFIFGIDFLTCLLLTAGIRFAGRLYGGALLAGQSRACAKGILIYGAGIAGTMLVREIRWNRRLNYKVIGFLDDDPNMRNAVLLGVPVLGTGREAAWIVEQYKHRHPRVEEIVIAMPSVAGRQGQIQEVLANCRAAGVPCKSVPSHEQLLSGKVRIGEIRNFSVIDLLGREPIQLDQTRLRSAIADRAVLVTGAAGSIGSELCLQLSRLGPSRLIAFDQAESGLFMIELDLRRKFSSLDICTEIGDIRDADRIDSVIHRHSVDLVFHAAAYKHVPLMESNILEAVKTNILGTWNVVQATLRHRVSGFLMISTDKAVNPTSIMGVTKRVAELIISGMPGGPAGSTKFVSVRFGNVLGSSGSVVPIFQDQIANGGPVTVTHAEARRFFMTVGEAVQLVLEASTMSKGSEVFALDMGESIRIMDLARNMISLSGLVPHKDIEIRITGLRPGEKMTEELVTDGENVLPTYHDKIKILQVPRVNCETIETWVAELKALVTQGEPQAVVAHLRKLVPEYQPAAAEPRAQREHREPEAASQHSAGGGV